MFGLDLSVYQLDRPLMVWVAVLVVLFLLLRERGLVGWPRARLFAASLTRGAAFLILVLALAGPHRFDEQPDLSLVFVMDASGSSSGGRLESAVTSLEEWWKQRGDVPASVVCAGEELALFDSPTELRRAVPAVHEHTPSDLGPALEIALEAFEPTSSKALILFSDGAVTSGQTERAASVASIRGVRIFPVPPDEGKLTAAARELALGDATVLEGDRIELELVVDTNSAASGAVILEDTAGRELDRRDGVILEEGETRIPLSFVATERGVRQLRARLEVEGDLFDSNDVAFGAIDVVGTPEVLVAGDREQARSFGRLLTSMTPSLTYRTTTVELPDSLENVDLLVWIDPPFKDIPEARGAQIRRFVRQGGRLIVIGGPRGLELEDEGQEDLKELLPVHFPKTERKEPAPLVVLYVVDQSDSMGRAAKFEIALTAVAESISMLDPESRVGVITFSDLPRWVVPITEAAQIETIKGKLSELDVYGGTSVYPALQLGYEALIEEEAKLKHVILLSDGRSVSTLRADGEVVHNIARRKFTLSSVAIGREADQDELRAVADIGEGRFYYTDDFSTIPQILLDETLTVVRSNKIDANIEVHAVEDSRYIGGKPPKGIDPEMIPDLAGYVRGMQKTTSELALATERGEPLLLGWRHGRGTVTLFTSDFEGDWSQEWKEWKDRSKLWHAVIKETLSPLPPPEVELDARIVDGELRLRYSILDSLRNPRNNLLVEGQITRPDGEQLGVSLQPTGPGRYGATLPGALEGGYLASVAAVNRRAGSVDASGGVIPGGTVRASAGSTSSAESRAGTLNLALLQRLASETGGRMDPEFAQVLEEGVDTRQVRVDSWLPLLWAALVLFFVDLAIRRLRVPRFGSRS